MYVSIHVQSIYSYMLISLNFKTANIMLLLYEPLPLRNHANSLFPPIPLRVGEWQDKVVIYVCFISCTFYVSFYVDIF